MLLVVLKANKLLERLTKKNCKTQIKKRFRVEKVIKRKGIKLNVNRKGYDSSSSSWIDKKDIINEWIFSEPNFSGERVKVELGVSNYATKADFKNVVGVETSKLA